MEHYWQECVRLPQRIQEWDAYKEMKEAIKHYLDVFPTLHKLNSKVHNHKKLTPLVTSNCLIICRQKRQGYKKW